MISPSSILSRGMSPPIGVKESCMQLTAPQETAVVQQAKSVESNRPKRISFPSQLPEESSSLANSGLPTDSQAVQTSTPQTNKVARAIKMYQACLIHFYRSRDFVGL